MLWDKVLVDVFAGNLLKGRNSSRNDMFLILDIIIAASLVNIEEPQSHLGHTICTLEMPRLRR